MAQKKVSLLASISEFCAEIEGEFPQIPEARKKLLTQLSDYIFQKFREKQTPKLMVICTHNSRRSHIGQIWLAVGADYYDLPKIQTYSGGTEATAFNPRAVDAFRRIGFDISTPSPEAENPTYQIRWKAAMEPYPAFSKKFDEAPNPQENFAAIMVCSEADAGCPFVAGSDFRLSLPYDDPKAHDGTEWEAKKYDERLRQIGREMLYAMSMVNA